MTDYRGSNEANGMKDHEALIKWESEGLKDVPTKNMKGLYKQLLSEFKARGYSTDGAIIKNPMSGDLVI